jgi:hypothetical protein
MMSFTSLANLTHPPVPAADNESGEGLHKIKYKAVIKFVEGGTRCRPRSGLNLSPWLVMGWIGHNYEVVGFWNENRNTEKSTIWMAVLKANRFQYDPMMAWLRIWALSMHQTFFVGHRS